MDDDIPIIDQQPAFLGLAFQPPTGGMLFAQAFQHFVRQAVQHPVAGAGTNDEIISKIGNFVNVEQDNILTFFLL